MSGKKKIGLALTGLLIVLFISLFLSFKVVVYVYPEGMSDYSSRYYKPRFFNLGYFLISRSDEEVSLFERIKKPSIYIYTPYCTFEEGKKTAKYTAVYEGGKTELDIDYLELYSSFLSAFEEEKIAFLFDSTDEENSSFYDKLVALYPELGKLEYEGRVSVVNSESLIASSDNMWGVIVTDPISSSSLYRNTISRVVMVESDAVAAVSLESVISLSFDWGRIIRGYLSSGEISPYYTFSVIH